jgi:hypothetical protein
MNTIDIIKTYTTNDTWTAICYCKACAPKGSLKVSIQDMADAVDRAGLNFTIQKDLKKINHSLIQAQA